MAFTFAQSESDNTMETYDLSISISPDTAIINEVYEAGGEAAGSIAVSNTGAVDAGLYLTADWGPSAGTSDRMATLLANALYVSVFVSSATVPDTLVYNDRLINLIDVSIFGSLPSAGAMDTKISVVLPSDHSGPTLLDKQILTDFVFVAVSVA